MSKKPSKTRKAFYTKAKHEAVKSVAAHLDEKLRKELGMRGLSVRKGDTVKVMRGTFKGKEGKVSSVNVARGKIFIEKVTAKKSNGSERQISFDASKVMIVDADRTDRKRFKKKESEKK